MQKTAFIWDLDGTLLDSYEAILLGIEETFAQFAIPYNKEKVREFILKYSVQDLLVQVAEERKLDVEFAQNSGIQSINFLESSYEGNYRIQALADIPLIFKVK
ncbi:MAG: HAD hydrolase-like protein [Streptococcus mitis]|nr:HAD hydrolase-like protein [Streptococcus mitis]